MAMDPRLYQGIANGNVKTLQQFESVLLQKTHLKNTALHVAVQFEKKDCVKQILKQCPSLLLEVNMNGDSALHFAARQGLYEILQLLINSAKRLGDRDSATGEKVSVLRQLVRLSNKENNTALHEALRYALYGTQRWQYKFSKVVTFLMEADGEFEYFPNNAGETPLFLAAEVDQERIYTPLYDRDGVLKHVLHTASHGGPNGKTALHAAVFSKNQENINMLLRHKPGINKEADDNGWTPLHYVAYFHSFEEICDQLLAFDSSIAYITDKNGMSALHLAAGQGNMDVITQIIHHCPDCSELLDHKDRNFLHIAALRGKREVVEYTLEEEVMHSESINQHDNDGNTPLHLAAISESYDIVQLLVRCERVNGRIMNKEDLTPLDIIKQRVPKLDDLNGGKVSSLLQQMEKVYAKTPRNFERDLGLPRNNKDDKKIELERERKVILHKMQKVSDSHLVVAALIATVTFAAGFALPGGYKNDGPNEGMATLLRKTAFRAFTVSNTIAMLLSSSAVLIHFFMKLIEDKDKVNSLLVRAFYYTFCAILAMVLAFVTGTYAVLSPSHLLAITACTIGCSFYLFCFYPVRYVSHTIILNPLLHCVNHLYMSVVKNFCSSRRQLYLYS